MDLEYPELACQPRVSLGAADSPVQYVQSQERTVSSVIGVVVFQFRKLGLLPPEETLPPSCRRTYQQLWANNGDAISQQYAGTAALKVPG